MCTAIGSNAWWLAHLSENSDIDIALSEVAKVSSRLDCTEFQTFFLLNIG